MKHTIFYRNSNHTNPDEAPAYSLRKISNKIGFMLCATIIAMYVFSYAAQWYLIGIGYQKGPFHEAVSILNYLLNGCVSVFSMLLPAFIFILIIKCRPQNIIVSRRVSPLIAISCFFIGTTVCLLANFPSNWISAMLESFGFQSNPQLIPVVPTVPSYLMNFFATAIVAPFVEEFLFRGLILSRFRKYGDFFAVIASALLFGLLHRNFSQIVFAFICGLALGTALVKTNCIWVTVGMHMFVNCFYVVLNIVRYHDSNVVYAMVFYGIILAFSIIALMCVFYLLIYKREIYSFQPGILSTGSGMANLFANPGVLLFAGVCIIQSIARLGVLGT